MFLKPTNPLFDETFIFRPIDLGYNKQGLLRYANGKWIPDDGEYDMAFVLGTRAYYVEIPQYSNLLWSWYDSELVNKWLPDYLHNKTRGWHTMTANNTPLDDAYLRYTFPHDDTHPNAIAGRSAMDKCCELHSSASGEAVSLVNGQYAIGDGKYFKPSKYLQNGLIKLQRTMQVVPPPPKNLECYLCKDNGRGHLINALQSYKSDLDCKLEDCQERINKAQSEIYDYEDTMKRTKEELPEVIKELKNLGVEINESEDGEC